MFLPEGMQLVEQLPVGRRIERGALVNQEKEVIESLAPKKAKPPDYRVGKGYVFAREGSQ